VLTLALAAGYAQAEDLPAEHKQELQNITVKGDISTRRVTTKKMDESTSTDMKDVLFNEPSINFGGGNATSQWVSIRGMGRRNRSHDRYSDEIRYRARTVFKRSGHGLNPSRARRS